MKAFSLWWSKFCRHQFSTFSFGLASLSLFLTKGQNVHFEGGGIPITLEQGHFLALLLVSVVVPSRTGPQG